MAEVIERLRESLAGTICPICKGSGVVSRSSFRNPRKLMDQDCRACKATGRLPPLLEDVLPYLPALLEIAEAAHDLREAGGAGADLSAPWLRLLSSLARLESTATGGG